MIKRLIFKLQLRVAGAYKRAELYHKKYGMKIGNNCVIWGSVDFGSEPYLITIGDHVEITDNVRFITHDGGVLVLNNMGALQNADVFGKISIGNNVFIGLNSIILPGTIIEDNVVIGAGSVVTKDIPSNTVAYGNPCRVRRENR
jgi:acetyltransferase-like isoleucine patch superfamily enzyme